MLSLFKKIIKAVFVSGALLMPFGASAQKMDTPEVDGFTNEITIFTSPEIVASTASGNVLVARFYRIGDTTYRFHIDCDVLTENIGYYSIGKGRNVLLKLANDSLITLTVMQDVVASEQMLHEGYYSNQYWNAPMGFYVSRDDIYKISQANFTGARIEADGLNIDFGIKPKESLLLKKIAALILAQK